MFDHERHPHDSSPTSASDSQPSKIEKRQTNEMDARATLTLERRQVSEEQMRKFAGYAADVKTFLRRGGIIAWGIVPVDPPSVDRYAPMPPTKTIFGSCGLTPIVISYHPCP